jgi:hypothetical protein
VTDRPPNLPPEQVREVLYSKRFLAADRAKLDVVEIATWDPYVVREHRLLVPVDLQALYVPAGSTEPMVRLPMLLRLDDAGDPRTPDNGMPELFATGTPREPGVHLHWAMPDALLRGRLEPQSGAGGGAGTAGSRLGMPALPDRWLVLRLLHPAGADQPAITGWVLFADRAVAVPLADFREESPAAGPAAGPALDAGRLTGVAGGSVAWSGVYDAVLNRFAFHDTLADVPAVAPGGVDSGCATYLVAGWWRTPAQDPLDAARSDDSLHELLDRLRWRLLYEWGDASFEQARRQSEDELRHALGLTTASRWDTGRPTTGTGQRSPRPAAQAPAAAAAASQAAAAVGAVARKVTQAPTSSAFVSDTASRYLPEIVWNLRSSLLHGAVFGVPVSGPVTVDHRPAPEAVGVALGEHDDDVVAALAAAGQPAGRRRDTERLLAAFTAQKVGRLATPDGAVEVEEHEHAAGFSSLYSGVAGTDRYLQRRQTGGVGGLDVGTASRASKVAGARSQPADAARTRRGPAAAAAGGGLAAEVLVSFGGKPNLVHAAELAVYELARSRVGDVLTATEERVVERPAARFTFPDDPLVAVRGLRRSLRHGGDGRGSADGKLTCRWPTHVVTEIAGLVPETAFVRSLGNGALPPETLPLAREAMLLDPYHDAWTARAVAPAAGVDRAALTRRLVAESVLRFGADATYDGATLAFHPNLPDTPAARRRALLDGPRAPAGQVGVRQQQVQVADELHRFSLYAGADPDLVGVTAWSQPWVPLWLEWEVEVAGLDPPTVRSWRLGQLDLDADDAAAAAAEGAAVTLRGRSLITTGGAGTLHDAITDWLAAEDARGADGEADAATEATLRTLATDVQNLDLATAALDGVRHQLLGLPAVDGLVRPAGTDGDGTTANPAPTSAPRALLAGIVRLTRARLLDAFGRTLDVPVGVVAVPSRLEVPAAPGAVGVPPRLLRPARWQLRLVDAATATGAEGTEARVDEIEPDLQVSPVAGFLLPDHLDESLEVFGADGSPLGELLHEPVGGGVVWEIAPGRSGPADAGPGYGLTPAQQTLGWFAGGLVAADAAARGRAEPPGESALSALLRAVDTTLWTVDSLASLGTEHVAGLVGRPLAVVRAQLRLELRPPTDVDLSDPARAAQWAAAEALAARYGFAVRIGELTRSDDGVLGFFVDDDYAHFHIVDKAIAGAAPDTGRSRGQLGLYGPAGGLPGHAPLDHPYIAGTGAGETLDDADTLVVHLGRTVTLTLLMHPAGKAHLTSGMLPRRATALARNWVGPGLAAMAPSLRAGPVLVETDLDEAAQVRLPKVSVFGTDQSFLWRDTPGTWRTDAILAATQSALLPDGPGELREGWIRVSPEPPPPASPSTPGEGPA